MPRSLVVARPRQWVVAPFSGDGMCAGEQATVDDDASAHPGADDDPEDHLAARAGAVGGLGQDEAVGVVGHAHFAVERLG
jgi:hypothetical protein